MAINHMKTWKLAGTSARTSEPYTYAWQRSRRSQRAECSAAVKVQAASGVRIDVEKTSWNSRRIFAAVAVSAPKGNVWSALTDYDNLHKFIPSLVENRCMERNGKSVVLYQVGAQDVAMGVKFSAAVTLRCTEFIDGGLPDTLMTSPPAGAAAAAFRAIGTSGSSRSSGSSSSSSSGSRSGSIASISSSSGDWSSDSAGGGSVEALFPYPSTTVPGVESSDISFELLEGDFQAFRGIWRMQQTGEKSTLLSYALFVKPQAWLPVALIQGRIENEVLRNLEAVSRYAEAQFKQQQAHQQRLLQH